jgi:outer membrane protein OmpA-like peptidoglycan-associated protein
MKNLTTTIKTLLALLIIGFILVGTVYIFDRLPQKTQEFKLTLHDSTQVSLTGNTDLDKTLLLTDKINLINYNIEFQSGSSELTQSGRYILDDIYTGIVLADGKKVELIGHTDNQGISQENLTLSERRAKSALEYLKTKGIESQRLVSKGRGGSEPIADNSTSSGRAKNRRVNISLFTIKE